MVGVPQPRFSRHLWKTIGFIVAIVSVVIGAIVARSVYVWRRQTQVRSLVEQGRRAGIALELGVEQQDEGGSFYANNRFRSGATRGIEGRIERITLEGSPLAKRILRMRGIRVIAVGEPEALYSAIVAMLREPHENVRVDPVDVSYTHPILGAVEMEGVTLENHGVDFAMMVRRVRLGGAVWQNVPFSLNRRGDYLVLGLGAKELERAPFELRHFYQPETGSTFTLRFVRQPLRRVLEALHWPIDANADGAYAMGSVTLVQAPSEGRIRGSAQLTVDDWPKPNWPHAEGLLGRRGSLLFRFNSVKSPFEFAATHIEATLPTVTLRGTGVVHLLGPTASVRLDVSGTQACTTLAKRLAHGELKRLVEGYLEQVSPKPLTTLNPIDEVRFRLQLNVGPGSELSKALSVAFEGGCGLPRSGQAQWTELDVPRFEP